MNYEQLAEPNLDQFTQAYIEAMLWSSTLAPYGECPEGGNIAVLCRWDEDDTHVCMDCSDCEPNYEPPADDNYGVCDISADLMDRIMEDCSAFQSDNDNLLADWYEKCGETEERAGHDFWLTREHHGAGYWDRWSSNTNEGRIGDELTKAAHAYGEMYLYVGDDGKIYGS